MRPPSRQHPEAAPRPHPPRGAGGAPHPRRPRDPAPAPPPAARRPPDRPRAADPPPGPRGRGGAPAGAAGGAGGGGGGGPDTLRAPWAVGVGRQPLGAGWVEVHVEDEARRLDLNAPELADAVPRLLALLGLDPGLADALADWTDADDAPRPRGAERDWYLAQTPPLVPRNRPFAR